MSGRGHAGHRGAGRPGRPRRVALGQNFLADPNLLDAIVRSAALQPSDVVLEVGGGEGVLTRKLAAEVERVHVIELDQRLREGLEAIARDHDGVELHMGDAVRFDFSALQPPPTAMVANLPYSVATPVVMRTLEEVPSLERWDVMVQREIADRMRARPGTKAYGAPSVLAQLCCRVEMVRAVDPAVFKPRPRVESAVVRLERVAPWPGSEVARLVRAAFAHRRKALARSVATNGVASRERVLAALGEVGLPPTSRAEELEPGMFRDLAEALG